MDTAHSTVRVHLNTAGKICFLTIASSFLVILLAFSLVLICLVIVLTRVRVRFTRQWFPAYP